jgi:hypothetical protein
MKNLGGVRIGSFILIFLFLFSVLLIPADGFSAEAQDVIHVNDFTIIGNKAMETEDVLASLEEYKDK